MHTLKINGKMGLFQKSVLKSYLNQQNKDVVEKAYIRFKKIYDSVKVEEIKKLKEEEYQTGFFNDIFINVLGYTLRPTKGFNFKVEQKNVSDSKKADGAILNAKEEIMGVVELKSTATKNLDLAKDQAFNYKHNHSTCKYVIVSNFDKVQFYINDSVNKEEFSLFNMTREDFSLFYLCLAKDNILSDLPLKIKESSISEEKQITSKFYKDYTAFRDELYLNIKKNNLQNQLLKEHTEKGIKLTLFKKTQKLLDRFLFILFAEDTSLLAPNFNQNILSKWETYKNDGLDLTLYDFYKKQFSFLDKGRVGTTDNEEIFAYNGGLFKPDPILDEIIKIDDDVLYKHSKQLSTYNFDSQVDVNILGHIFENSLNEIENITAEIEGDSVDKQKTKRKKDGIFYTPKYITKYIVDNTVGKLCDEKKIELGINDVDTNKTYTLKTPRTIEQEIQVETRVGFTTSIKKIKSKLSVEGDKLISKIEEYRQYLLGLTIVDPACGSGAFLNQALVFLINEHKYLDELQSTITGSSFVFQNIENVVLEKNIYGVDINEESVEIAKLSLWLRTAQPRRKLNDLSNNIKCGNSLIDVKTVAGDKAFKWENEFPHVFANGGFDVVIGNPPYLNMTKANTDIDSINFYIKNYDSVKTANSKNIYTLFNELAVRIVKEKSLVSFIIPEGFLKTRSYNDCVLSMNKYGKIYKALYFDDWVFEDATTGSVIFEYIKDVDSKISFEEFKMNKNKEIFKISSFINPVLDKYDSINFPNISDLCDLFKGMAVKDRSNYIHESNKDNFPNIFLLGNCIDRYVLKNKFYCDYNELTIVGGTKKLEKHSIFPRILIRRTGDYLCCVMLNEPALTESTLYSCSIKNNNISLSYLLALLNSKFLTYIVRNKMITNEQAFPQIMMTDIQLLKIPIIDKEEQIKIGDICKALSDKSNEKRIFTEKFISYLKYQLNLNKISNKLQNWYNLSFPEFLKELNKVIKDNGLTPLTKIQEMEWLDVFELKKAEAQALKLEIDKTDKEIDNLVYNLYGLTATEIELVENTIN